MAMLLNFGSYENPTGDEDPGFARFKRVYPRKEAWLDARREWRKLRPDAHMQELIMQALEWQMQQASWQEDGGKWIPRADKWIRGGRWLDEPPAEQPAKLDWFAECREMHGGACGLSQQVHHTRKILDAGRQAT